MFQKTDHTRYAKGKKRQASSDTTSARTPRVLGQVTLTGDICRHGYAPLSVPAPFRPGWKSKRPEGSGVDVIGEALELDAWLLQLANHIDQVLDAAVRSLRFPHDRGIACAQHLPHIGQSGPLIAAAANLVVENLLAACLGQGKRSAEQGADLESRHA